jgi:hypothetical protein
MDRVARHSRKAHIFKTEIATMLRRSSQIIILLSFLAGLFACGPTLQPPTISRQQLEQEAELQRELLFKSFTDRSARLQRIYVPLKIANADLCGSNIFPATGIIGIDRQSIPANLRDSAQRLYGVSDGITIIDVVPNTPASDAGLQPRDVITGAARGAGTMPSGWTWSSLTIADLVKVLNGPADNSITFLIRRNGNVSPVVLNPRVGCNYPIQLIPGDDFNAFSDGKRIVVYDGLFNHVPDDREMAVIVSHELAHNILRHVEKRQGNAAAGGAAGLLVDIGLAALGINTQGAFTQAAMEAGAKAYSQEFELEADYLAMYMLARADFDFAAGPDLIRRMGVQDPRSQIKTYFSTHPSTPERAVAMTQTIKEIQDKVRREEALLPKNLEGQNLPVNTAIAQSKSPPVVATVQTQVTVPTTTASPKTTVGFLPATQTTSSSVNSPAPAPASAVITKRLLAQLYLIRGPVVTNPPQVSNGEFLPNGKVQVNVSGRRLLTGEFELFGLTDSFRPKHAPSLINPETLKISRNSDTKGFAALSDDIGMQLECVYSLTRSNGRGEGICADNQRNTYRIVLE